MIRLAWLALLLSALALSAAVLTDCGDTDAATDAGNGDDAGTTPDGNDIFGDAAMATITIEPKAATLHAAGMPLTQQFTAYDQNHVPVVATWSLDNVQLGSIDAKGLFSTPGTVGGGATITAQSGTSSATATIAVDLTLTENPGNLSGAVIAQLQAGGAADPGFTWLYPYDKTVFPRGLTAPLMQFPTSIDAAWVHAETASKSIVYDGYFGASNPSRIQWSPSTWTTISQAPIGKDPLTVRVTKLSGGQVTGPISETWNVAPGTLRGVLYYNSYTSGLTGAGVLKLKPGGSAVGLVGNCTVCHTVSAKGNALFAALDNGTGNTGAKYDLTGDAGPSVTSTTAGYTYQMAGVYPDGTLILSNTGFRIPRMPFTTPALYDTSTGMKVAATGFDGVVTYANTPAFSADGKQVAFNDGVANDAGAGNSISVMDFDVTTKTFANRTTLVTQAADQLLGWPSFLPDGKSIVYDHYLGPTSSGSYLCGDPSGLCYDSRGGQTSVLEMVDRATKTVTNLDELSGFEGGKLYLPFGPSEDEHFDFEPTVLPLSVGGYYWVVFGSRRHYGNVTSVGETSDTRMKLWVSAIDIDATPGKDPSHPAFYLPGQEDGAGNMRGYWVLPACEANGQACTGGDECCSGQCVQQMVDGGTQGVCGTSTGCAHVLDKCAVDGDCCGASTGVRCINGFCAAPTPQ